MEEHFERFSLKPYYCVLFPLTKVDGVFEYDDLCSSEADCCTAVPDGRKKIVEMCSIELEYALGHSKHEEVLEYHRKHSSDVTKEGSLKHV